MIRELTFYLGISLFFLCGCTPKSNNIPHPNQQSTFLVGGIQISEASNKRWICTLKEIGMNTIAVTDYALNAEWDKQWFHCRMSEGDWSLSAANKDCKTQFISPFLLDEIATAKSKGFNVVFIPRVALEHYFKANQFLWHGMIMPETDSMVVEWFKYYGRFVVNWAKVCEKYQVDVMAIGSELRMLSATLPISKLPVLEAYYLNPAKQRTYIEDRLIFKDKIAANHLWSKGTENYKNLEDYLKDEVKAKVKWAKQVTFQDAENPVERINQRRQLLLGEWYKLIKKVRKVYSGKLTYAANFDNYQNVGFWNKLDYIGINAYFGLQEATSETPQTALYPTFKKSWKTVFKDIQDFQQTQNIVNKKVIFTELGYINRENCTMMPWKGEGFSIVNQDNIKKLYIWKEENINEAERALAVKALQDVHFKMENSPLKGILYWKLTTQPYHLPHEPFALNIKRWNPDPIQKALVSFLPHRKKQFWEGDDFCN